MKNISILVLAMVSVVVACSIDTQATVIMDWVIVGDPGNVGELSGSGAGGFGPDRICGAVNYTYQIGKYEVTNAQYCEFLNAVASTDTYSLYHTNMSGTYGGISQSGSSGNLEYSVKNGWENKPVNWVSWYDSIRFVNWMQNGQGSGDTETGAYTITDWDGINETVSNRNAGTQIWLPSEDEWYKAAYYKGGSTDSGYWDYATQSDTVPTTGQVNYFNVPGAPTDVGSYAFPSAYNTFDQNGNMWEWNEVLIEEPFGEMRRGKRGGSWSREAATLPASDRNYNYPGIQANDVGFRVASVPEPATLLLLGLGGLMIRKRK